MATVLDFIKSKTRLSPREQEILQILPVDGAPVSTDALTKTCLGKVTPNRQNMVTRACRDLEEKTKRLKTRVKRSKRAGPHAMQVWLDVR